MAQLRQDYAQFQERGAEVVAVAPDKARALADYWREHELPFVGLPDPSHRVARRYGQEVNLLKLGRMPALMLIDRRGCIRFKHYASSMSDIPENAEILARLQELEDEGGGASQEPDVG